MPTTFTHNDPQQGKPQGTEEKKPAAASRRDKNKSGGEGIPAWVKNTLVAVFIVGALGLAVWSGSRTLIGPQEEIVGSLDGGVGEGKPGSSTGAGPASDAVGGQPATGTDGGAPAADPSNPTGKPKQ